MSLKSKLNKLCIAAFAALCLNQALVPVSNFVIPNILQRNNISVEKAKSQKYVIGEDYTQIELFCLAYSSKKYFKTKEDSLRDSSCSDEAKSIKKMYKFFAEKAGKPKLTDKLRVVEGMLININDRRWHYWLELETSEGGKLYFDPSSYYFPDFAIIETSYVNASSEKQLIEEDYLNDIFEEDLLNESFEEYAGINDIPDASTIRYPYIDSFDAFSEYYQSPKPKLPDTSNAVYENLAYLHKVRCGTAQMQVRLNYAMEFTLAREWKGIMVPTAEGLLYPGGFLGLAYELLSDFNSYMRDLNPNLENILPFLPKEKIDQIEKALPWIKENKLINPKKVLKHINIINISERPQPIEKYSDIKFLPEEKYVKD